MRPQQLPGAANYSSSAGSASTSKKKSALKASDRTRPKPKTRETRAGNPRRITGTGARRAGKGVKTNLSASENRVAAIQVAKSIQQRRSGSAGSIGSPHNDEDASSEEDHTSFDATAKAKVIDPDSVVIVPWTVFIFFLTVYNAFVIPFRASFGFVNQNLGFFFFFDLFGDVCFLLDIVLNFRKGFYRHGMRKVMNKKEIVQHYQQTFFVFDLLASMPFDIIQLAAGRLLPWTRVFKLLRVFHLVHILSELELSPNVNKTAVSLFKYMFYLGLSVHSLGCVWYWLSAVDGFGANLFRPSEDMAKVSQTNRYLFSISWAISMMSNLGLQSNGFPVTELDASVGIITMLVGTISISYTIGNVARVFNDQVAARRTFENRRKGVKFMLETFECSEKMVKDTLDYFDYKWKMSGGFTTDAWINEMPYYLRNDVQRFEVQTMMERLECLKDLGEDFRQRLLEEIQIVEYVPGSRLVRLQQPCSTIFFIIEGEFQVHVNGRMAATSTINLCKGSVYGFWPAVKGQKYVDIVEAKNYSVLGMLSKESLISVLELYPIDHLTFKALVEKAKSRSTNSYHNQMRTRKGAASGGGNIAGVIGMDHDLDDNTDSRRKGFSVHRIVNKVLPVMMFVVDFFNLLSLPFRLLFAFESESQMFLVPMYILERIGDCVLYTNIWNRFRTPFMHDGRLIQLPAEIRRLYLRLDFPFDLICIFPLDIIMGSLGGSLTNPYYRLHRLIRVPKLASTISLWREKVAPSSNTRAIILHISVLSLLYILMAHVVGTAYYALAFYNDFVPTSFIPGPRLKASSPMERYLFSIFYSYNMLNRLGSRVFPSIEFRSHLILTICGITIGIVMGSLLIGQMGAIVGGQSGAGQLNRKLHSVAKFVRARGLPESTRRQIATVLLHRWQKTRGHDFNWLFRTLPFSLRVQFISTITRGRISTSELLRNSGVHFIDDLSQIAKFEFLPEGQALYTVGDSADSCYYVMSGRIGLYSSDHATGLAFKFVAADSFVGLRAVVESAGRHSETASITEDSALLVFDHVELQGVLKKHRNFSDLLMIRLRQKLEQTRAQAGAVEMDTLNAEKSNVNIVPRFNDEGWSMAILEDDFLSTIGI